MIRPTVSCPHCGAHLVYTGLGGRCYCSRCDTVGRVTRSTATSICVEFTRAVPRFIDVLAQKHFAVGAC